MRICLFLISLLTTIVPISIYGQDWNYRSSERLRPSDYLFGSNEKDLDSSFDDYETIDLGVKLRIGADCGRIDVGATLKAAVKNILNADYFIAQAEKTVAAAPMLALCYLSPTLCAILKHSEVNASLLGKMRLDQCALIDKYVDSRVEDFYEERQNCVRRVMDGDHKGKKGNIEEAMATCSNSSVLSSSLSNWQGDNGGRTRTNRLIESSTKWAGFNHSKSTTRRALNLIKGLVGDTILGQGRLSIDYGPYKAAITPRTYLMKQRKITKNKLCNEMVGRLVENPDRRVDQLIRDQDLRKLSGERAKLLVDRNTIEALSLMPFRKQEVACQKLSDAIALTLVTDDLNRSIDMLAVASQNPHLPANRKREIQEKRDALIKQVEASNLLYSQRNKPLNETLYQINSGGEKIRQARMKDNLSREVTNNEETNARSRYLNCADGLMCM